MVEFEWDKKKATENWCKHRIRFEDARFVFDDPLQMSESFVENGEVRWRTIGIANACILLLVIHTVRENGTEIIRIISARKLTPEERKDYELG